MFASSLVVKAVLCVIGTKLSQGNGILQVGLADRWGMLKSLLALQKKKVYFTELCITWCKVKGIPLRAGIWILYSMKTAS